MVTDPRRIPGKERWLQKRTVRKGFPIPFQDPLHLYRGSWAKCYQSCGKEAHKLYGKEQGVCYYGVERDRRHHGSGPVSGGWGYCQQKDGSAIEEDQSQDRQTIEGHQNITDRTLSQGGGFPLLE